MTKTMIKLEEVDKSGEVIYTEFYQFLKELCKKENTKRGTNAFSWYYLKRFKYPIQVKNFLIDKVEVNIETKIQEK